LIQRDIRSTEFQSSGLFENRPNKHPLRESDKCVFLILFEVNLSLDVYFIS